MMAGIFYNPVVMGREHLWLVLPLCAVVALVYKTIRVARLRDLPGQILGLWGYMLGGLVVLGAILYFLV